MYLACMYVCMHVLYIYIYTCVYYIHAFDVQINVLTHRGRSGLGLDLPGLAISKEPLIKTLVSWKLLLQSDSVKHLHCIVDTSPSLAYVIIMIADANRDKYSLSDSNDVQILKSA